MKQAKYMTIATICATAILIGGCGKDGNGNGGAQTATPKQSSSGGDRQTPSQSQVPAPSVAGGTSSSSVPSSPSDLAAVAEQNRKNLIQMNQGKEVVAVTTDAMQGLLPETLAGMKRTNVNAERNQSMGIDLTTGEATYGGQNDASIDLQITDVGNMTGPMRMGMAAWTMAQYDRKTDTGYEKTGTYSGYKGMEEYDSQNKSGMIKIFVADRFIVEVNGNNVTMETLKQALGQIDLKKVASPASGS